MKYKCSVPEKKDDSSQIDCFRKNSREACLLTLNTYVLKYWAFLKKKC